MNFLNKLEKKYRKYAIPNLMYYIVMLYGAGLVIQLFAPMAYWRFLSLDIGALMHGQIWRLVTFIIYPPTMGTFVFDSAFFGIISLFLYYSLGVTLERVWGAFRFNVFFLMGMVGEILAALVSYFVFHQNLYVTTGFLNFSLISGLCHLFSGCAVLLIYGNSGEGKVDGYCRICSLRVLVFWLAQPVPCCEIVLSLANVILFFLMTRNYSRINPKEIHRKQQFKQQTKIRMPGQPRHKCAVCGRTEADGENLEFRYCSKCAGNLEYCQDHLYTHKHVTIEGENPQ